MTSASRASWRTSPTPPTSSAATSTTATDVFIVRRQGPWGQHGTPWTMGGTELASKGMGGAPANGPSTRPALDGDSHHARAASRSSRRRSTSSRATPTAARRLRPLALEPARSPACPWTPRRPGQRHELRRVRRRRLRAGRLQLRLHEPRWRERPQAGLRALPARRRATTRSSTARPLLASASTKGAAGNGDSWQPQFARAGKAVVFHSLASNLAGGDANRVSGRVRADDEARLQACATARASRSCASAPRSSPPPAPKQAGNGASSTPSVSDDGRFVAYQTLASNLL
jgi:hypothetical protein